MKRVTTYATENASMAFALGAKVSNLQCIIKKVIRVICALFDKDLFQKRGKTDLHSAKS